MISATYHSCKRLTVYELDKERYDIALENIINFQRKFNNDSLLTMTNDNVENIFLENTTNKFFFYEPFHLKVFIKVFKKQTILKR